MKVTVAEVTNIRKMQHHVIDSVGVFLGLDDESDILFVVLSCGGTIPRCTHARACRVHIKGKLFGSINFTRVVGSLVYHVAAYIN